MPGLPDYAEHTIKPTHATANNTLIAYENSTRTWAPSNGAVFKPSTACLRRIGSLAGGCRIDPTASGDYIIRGDSDIQLQKAVSKLQVLDNAAVSLIPRIRFLR